MFDQKSTSLITNHYVFLHKTASKHNMRRALFLNNPVSCFKIKVCYLFIFSLNIFKLWWKRPISINNICNYGCRRLKCRSRRGTSTTFYWQELQVPSGRPDFPLLVFQKYSSLSPCIVSIRFQGINVKGLAVPAELRAECFECSYLKRCINKR